MRLARFLVRSHVLTLLLATRLLMLILLIILLRRLSLIGVLINEFIMLFWCFGLSLFISFVQICLFIGCGLISLIVDSFEIGLINRRHRVLSSHNISVLLPIVVWYWWLASIFLCLSANLLLILWLVPFGAATWHYEWLVLAAHLGRRWPLRTIDHCNWLATAVDLHALGLHPNMTNNILSFV